MFENYATSVGPSPEHAVWVEDEFGEQYSRPTLLRVCGHHSRTQGAHEWRAAGGGLYIGSACDIDGCKGE